MGVAVFLRYGFIINYINYVIRYPTLTCFNSNSSSGGYIIAGCDGGLANRLRVLAAYIHIAKYNYKSELMFIWDVNSACPGHFLQIFEPIEGVIFAHNSSRSVFGNANCTIINYSIQSSIFFRTIYASFHYKIEYLNDKYNCKCNII